MRYEIQYRPAHSLATAQLEAGETIRAEASAMVSMTNNVAVRTEGPAAGSRGMFGGLKRSLLGGESFFTNTFTAQGGPGHVSLAPQLCGDMVVHSLSGEPLLIQGSSYVSAPESVVLDTKFQGLKGFLSGESLFFLLATGHGPVLINAFGAIETLQLDGELVVDTGHVVAFTAGIDYQIGKATSGWITSWLSGEGLVLRLRGRGTLYLQSRNPHEYGTTVGTRLPARRA